MLDYVGDIPVVKLTSPVKHNRDYELVVEVPIEWKFYSFKATLKVKEKSFEFEVLKSDNDIVTTLRLRLTKEITAIVPAPEKNAKADLVCTNLDGKTFDVLEFLIETKPSISEV